MEGLAKWKWEGDEGGTVEWRAWTREPSPVSSEVPSDA